MGIRETIARRRLEMILKYVWRVFITVVLVYMVREDFAPAFEAVWLELSFALNQWTHHSF